MSHVVVVGSGFAGLWAALGAARRLDEFGVPPGAVRLTVVSDKPFHDIRVRNYEADLTGCRLPLADLLDPVGIAHRVGEVTAIDVDAATVATADGDVLGYDRLVLAAGSRLVAAAVPGLAEHGFDVDTFDRAAALDRHLRTLAARPRPLAPGAATAVVVGAGLTGVETACELPARLTALFGTAARPRVVLVDHRPRIGSDMGDSAVPVIESALRELGIEVRTGAEVTAVHPHGLTLADGEAIRTETVVWCAGMRANPLTAQLGVATDRLGRLAVDDCLRVTGAPGVFAAGDVAAARLDDRHLSVMSCQHARPMGRFAGYNVIGDLLGAPMRPLRIPWYVTVLDLGAAGALHTEGWRRRPVAQGAEAKATKREINTRRIYPPLPPQRTALLTAAAPVLQDRPGVDC